MPHASTRSLDATQPLRYAGFAKATALAFIAALEGNQVVETPYRHWLLTCALPDSVARAIADLPWTPPRIADTRGARDTNNATRTYFTVESRRRYPVCDDVANTFQSLEVVATIKRTCGTDLSGTSLRIEYCQDSDGFWLAPHTDIGVKRFTMQIYLSEGPGSEDWGTDLLNPDCAPACRAPSAFNAGLIFIPAPDTWHAFLPRPINGVRRSLLVNYVGPEWRARHELSFPDTPVA